MLHLSIDCGTQNLAFCVWDDTTNTLVDWRVCTVAPRRCNVSVAVKGVVQWVSDVSAKHKGITKVYIEQQPVANTRMKCLSHAIQACAMCTMPQAVVDFVSPKRTHTALGLCSGQQRRSYSMRKQQAVSTAHKVLESMVALRGPHDDTWRQWVAYFNSVAKQDDLADCFLQCVVAAGAYPLCA